MRQFMMIIASMLLVVSFAGCTSVHTDGSESSNLAVWIGSQPQQHRLVRDVLREHGIPATVDERGVAIDDADSRLAYEVLLCDSRLEGSGLMVYALVEAGTGIKSDRGIAARIAFSDESDAADER